MTSIDLPAAETALRDSAGRVADLLRRVPDATVRAGSLDWTIAETAAHLVGSTELFAAFASGDRSADEFPGAADRSATPAERNAAGNTLMLDEVKERDLARLADMLPDAVDRFIKASSTAPQDARFLTEGGVAMTPQEMTSAVLGEQLVHGFDIARGARLPWAIPTGDALLVIAGIVSLIPEYVDKRKAAGVRVGYELRFRGGPRYRVFFDDGTARIGGTGRVDCWISVDPTAFLLIGYGRVGQWSQVLRGKVMSGGRKPWLGLKFADMLTGV